MPRWVLIVGVVAAALAATAGGSAAIATIAWNRATARTLERLRSHGSGTPHAQAIPYAATDVAGLPAPVVRYFAFALREGQPLIRHARLGQAGTFARRDAWSPFTATEYFEVGPPGFVWDARIRIAPLVTARVRDSYISGEGAILGKIDALVPVVDQHGTAEMASGALLRYLAEAVWLPTALLPRAGVRWSAVDDSTARATITDRATTVTMDVHFGAHGEITKVTAQRYRDVNGRAELTSWIGRFQDYSRVEGIMIPITSEVGWMLPDGWFPYWRGRTLEAEFDTL